MRQNLVQDLHTKLSQFDIGANGAEKAWVAVRDTVYDTALTHLGLNTSKHQDWFDDNDDEIQKLLGEKRDTHRTDQQDRNSASKKAANDSTKRRVQAKLREMQDSWLSKKGRRDTIVCGQ